MPPQEIRLTQRWDEVLQNHANRAALIDAEGRVVSTFAEIEAECGDWLEKLEALPPRAVVGIQLANQPRWPAILLAIWRKNGIALLLDASLRSDLTGKILENASARFLIHEKGLRHLHPTEEKPFPSDTSLLKVTSGTTGISRLIAFNDTQLLADSDSICATMGLQTSDINYGAIPFSHSYGFSNLLLPLLTSGIPLVVSQDNFPHAMMAGLTKSRATILAGVPIFYHSLARLGLTLPTSVRLCISASAPLCGLLAGNFYSLNGRKIHSFYGASECGGICYDASAEVDLPPGFVGQPMRGVAIQYCAESNHIVIQSPAVGQTYLPSGPDDALRDGTFHPADLVEKTAVGYQITGRISDFVNITGKKLDPQMVESVIEKIPGVSRAFVCGIPHERRGELAIAIVETHAVRREEVFSACRKVLSPWQLPSDVWLLEKIPATERGKMVRRELAQKYLDRELLSKS